MGELATQYVDLAIGGVDTKSAPEIVQPPKCLSLVNVDRRQTGAVELRDGYAQLSRTATQDGAAGATHGVPSSVFVNGDTLHMIADGRIYARDPSDTRWRDVERTAFPISYKDVIYRGTGGDVVGAFTGDTIGSHDLCVDGTGQEYLCAYFKLTRGGASYAAVMLLDATSLRRVHVQYLTPAPDRDTGRARLMCIGDAFVLVYIESNNLKARAIDLTNIAAGWGAAVTLAAGTASTVFEVCSRTEPVVVYRDSAGNLAAIRVAVTGTVPSVATGPVTYGAVTLSGWSIAVDALPVSGDVVVVYGTTTPSVIGRVLNATTLASGTPFTLASVAIDRAAVVGYDGAGSDRAAVAYCQLSTAKELHDTHFTDVDPGTGSAYTAVTENGSALVDAGFARGSEVYFGLARDRDGERCLYTYRYDKRTSSTVRQAHPVGRHLPLTAAEYIGATSISLQKRARVCVAGYRWITTAIENQDDNAWGRDQLCLVSVAFDDTITRRGLTVGQIYVVPGSLPRMIPLHDAAASYGDAECASLGSLHSPAVPTLAAFGGLGSLSNGTYHYKWTIEYVDQSGRLVRGQVSPEDHTIATAAGDAVRHTLTADSFGPLPRANVTWVIWRTTVNPSELIYYRVAAVDNGTLSYYDSVSDATIATREVLNTSAGELENFAPPPCSAMCKWNGRLWALDSETGRIWPSKLIVDGEWPGWNEALSISTDVNAGKRPVFISADAQQLLVWWDDAIGAVYGEAASDTGAPGTLTLPQVFSRGIGLRDVNSFVHTPVGDFFQSGQGIYLRGADNSLSLVGRDVAGNDNDGIVGATYHADTREVRFVIDGGAVLVYDLEAGDWSTYTLPRTPAAAAVWRGTHVLAMINAGDDDTDFGVWQQSSSTPTDTDVAQVALLRTAWLKFAGMQGRQRVRKLWLQGTFPVSGCTVDLAYNFGALSESHTVVGTATAGQVIEIPLATQECKSVRVDVTGFTRLLPPRVEVEVEKGTLRRNVTVA